MNGHSALYINIYNEVSPGAGSWNTMSDLVSSVYECDLRQESHLSLITGVVVSRPHHAVTHGLGTGSHSDVRVVEEV